MDEAEWLTCECPGELIDELNQRDAASPRKFRLFACACVRLVWHLAPAGGRAGVEVAERHADGLATDEELDAASHAAETAFKNSSTQCSESDPRPFAALAAARASWTDGRQNHGHAEGAVYVVMNVTQALALEVEPMSAVIPVPEGGEADLLQCRLYRDVMGNPFRPVTLDPSTVTPTVLGLAQAAYDERVLPGGELDPQRLAVLADALEEGGAGEEAVGHLREPGPHVRGCWVVDLCLGKQ
jgi:hypothetical protein